MSRVKGQNAEKMPGWGLRLVSVLVPWALSQRSRKGLRLEGSLLPRPRESSALCPAFPKVFRPILPLGTPGTPSCVALPVSAPTPTQPQRTSATKQDLPDASLALLALGRSSLGAGEEGSHPPRQGQAGYSGGCPLVPGPRLSLGALTCDPLQRERAGGGDTLGCLDLRRCSLRLPPSLAPFFLPNPVFLQTTVHFIRPVVRRGPCSPDGLLWSRQRAGSLQHRPLPRGRRAPCTGGAQLAAGQHPRQNTAHSSLSRPGEPAALDARPYRRGCVPCPRRNRLCCQPLLVPGRAVSAAWAALELGRRRQGGTRTLATCSRSRQKG